MPTETKIAGIKFDSYICNASGPLDSTLEELENIGNSGSPAITMKSCTILPRQGNDEPRYVHLPLGAIQSMGLPNLGYQEYVRFSSQLKKHNKPIIASVAGLSVEDYRIMVEAFQKSDADLIEVNLSCPNLEGKPQVAYDFEQTEKVLLAVSNLGTKPIGLKLPPFYDFVHHKQIADLIRKYKISFITCINSVGNTLVIDPETETPVIKPKRGYGGLCGDYIKPIALANVRAFYELLKDEVSIFGVGGIKSGTDAFEFLLAGADAVQVAIVFEKEGPSCFKRINQELEEILQRKGYNSIQDVRGKLKYL
jgi:dihydroorotate dehydrogenase (fumarate)